MEDGWFDGQLYRVKHKAKLGNFADIETEIKAGHPEKNVHKLKAEHKVKGDISDFGGVKFEFKGKEDGSVEYKEEFRALQSTEGLENVTLLAEGKLDNKNGYVP